jgi:hypothetical protein
LIVAGVRKTHLQNTSSTENRAWIPRLRGLAMSRLSTVRPIEILNGGGFSGLSPASLGRG